MMKMKTKLHLLILSVILLTSACAIPGVTQDSPALPMAKSSSTVPPGQQAPVEPNRNQAATALPIKPQAAATTPSLPKVQVFLPSLNNAGAAGEGAAYPPAATLTPLPLATLPPLQTRPGDIARLAPYQPHTGEKQTYEQWMKWPVLPVVSQRAKDIYQRGLARNNDPKKFSKIGDCQVIRQYFLGYFDNDEAEQVTRFGNDYSKFKGVLQNFSGSYTRASMAVRTGFNVASVLSAINSDPQICKAGETPLQCEFRVWNPSIAIISMETWTQDRPTTAYEGYLRQIIDFVIARDVVPILATKADNLEGDHSMNAMVARVAAEYDIPLWNFWAATDPLPSHGLEEDGFHLTNGPSSLIGEGLKIAWNVRNLTALQTLDKIWREVSAKK